tara:strand:+ start:375 stop:2687 length:2313 start_codon:yes stop_codon:yes gene_type:complete
MKLVIVESPAKCSKISNFLGPGYCVKASYGHIRDLSKGMGAIDIQNKFTPTYIITPSKQNIVRELRKEAKKATEVIIASDLDREGEAIGFHVAEVLKLDIRKTKRIVFNKITKSAVQEAMANARTLDMNLVFAQQARRILDRLIGFTLSPVLWKYVRHSLSAGRCQSPALKLIQQKEQEIQESVSDSSSFVCTADFVCKNVNIPSKFTHGYQTVDQVREFLDKCPSSTFRISVINCTDHKNSPPPPFVTSTLQQSASTTLNIAPKETMQIAQKLYEAGLITYMRTDSKELSPECLTEIEEYITENYSDTYFKMRKYTSKSKNTQEAHEAIRPVYVDNPKIEGEWSSRHKSLYSLIWKRTMASQMSDKLSEQKHITVEMKTEKNEIFNSNSTFQKTTFPGFSILYEKVDTKTDKWDEAMVLVQGDAVEYTSITGTQTFSSLPPRYTEASLIKTLEKKGIGRPSTYSSIITTILDRSYVEKRSSAGVKKDQYVLTLSKSKIKEEKKKVTIHKEKNKLFITDIGMEVSLFLDSNFDRIMNFKYTSDVEDDLDKIAQGEAEWSDVVQKLYDHMMSNVDKITAEPKNNGSSKKFEKQSRLLGEVQNKCVYIFQGKKGKVIQWGESDIDGTQYYILSIDEEDDTQIEDVQLSDTLYLFLYPKQIGTYEKNPISIHKGPYGLYLKYKSSNYSIPKDKPILTEKEAIVLIVEQVGKKKHLGGDIYIIKGPYGFYINKGKTNRSLPREYDPKTVSVEEAKHILSQPRKGYKKFSTKKKT